MATSGPAKRALRVSDETAERIRGLHPDIKRRVRAALKTLLSDPSVGKSLKDELNGLKSFRVGRFRIIYRVPSDPVIEIVAVVPRRVIYEMTYRCLRREERKKGP